MRQITKTNNVLRGLIAGSCALFFLLFTANASALIHLDSLGKVHWVTVALDDAGAVRNWLK